MALLLKSVHSTFLLLLRHP
jgi:hypothetical protein